ncbi:MAG: arginase [Epulopiscium sp.]|nr:arginase [Candidatus Epulonipiscium sp.]
MKNCLLSIDWDYFIYPRESWGIYFENSKSLMDLWYKRYIQAKARGEDIYKAFWLFLEPKTFWNKIKKCFKFTKNIKTYVSDSHVLSYELAKENNCEAVYLFDAHSDLGYGGFSSLNFEVNCSNWLGKLLKDKLIKEANIFYSPYTSEKPEDFKPMNDHYNIRYWDLNHFDQCIMVSVIHICRSGAWTPPWLDNKFIQFIDSLKIPYEIVDCPERKWNPDNFSLSDQINYLLV